MELITLPTGLDNFLVSPINRSSYYLPELVMGKTGYDDGGLFVAILSKIYHFCQECYISSCIFATLSCI